MTNWTHKPQEQSGDYFFDGRPYQSNGVAAALSAEEIRWIVLTLERFIRLHSGADHLQIFECEDGRTVWCICQLSRSMKKSGYYAPEDDYWTMLLPEEYKRPPQPRGGTDGTSSF